MEKENLHTASFIDFFKHVHGEKRVDIGASNAFN